MRDCANWAKELRFGLGLIFKLGEKDRFDILTLQAIVVKLCQSRLARGAPVIRLFFFFSLM